MSFLLWVCSNIILPKLRFIIGNVLLVRQKIQVYYLQIMTAFYAFLCSLFTNTYSLKIPFLNAIIKLIREGNIPCGNKIRKVKMMCGFDFSCIMEILRNCFTGCGR